MTKMINLNGVTVETKEQTHTGMDTTYVQSGSYWMGHHTHLSGHENTFVMCHHNDDDTEIDVEDNEPGITAIGFQSKDEFNGTKHTTVFVNDSDLVALRDLLTKRIAAVRRSNKEVA